MHEQCAFYCHNVRHTHLQKAQSDALFSDEKDAEILNKSLNRTLKGYRTS